MTLPQLIFAILIGGIISFAIDRLAFMISKRRKEKNKQ